MKAESMDAVFQALSSAARRGMLDVVRSMPGCSVNDVAGRFEMSRIAVMKHLRVLQAARLITSKKQGRVRQLHFNPVPIQMIYDRWTNEYSRFWATQAADLKYMAETIEQDAGRKEESSRKRRRAK